MYGTHRDLARPKDPTSSLPSFESREHIQYAVSHCYFGIAIHPQSACSTLGHRARVIANPEGLSPVRTVENSVSARQESAGMVGFRSGLRRLISDHCPVLWANIYLQYLRLC